MKKEKFDEMMTDVRNVIQWHIDTSEAAFKSNPFFIDENANKKDSSIKNETGIPPYNPMEGMNFSSIGMPNYDTVRNLCNVKYDSTDNLEVATVTLSKRNMFSSLARKRLIVYKYKTVCAIVNDYGYILKLHVSKSLGEAKAQFRCFIGGLALEDIDKSKLFNSIGYEKECKNEFRKIEIDKELHQELVQEINNYIKNKNPNNDWDWLYEQEG